MPNRVLLVDGDDRLCKSIRTFLLRKFGFQVCGEMADILEAIQKVPYLKPDLVILEVSTGIEAMRELKRILPHTPIILFTMHESLLKGFLPGDLGVDAVVAKDFGVSALGDAVTSLLSRSSGEHLYNATRSRLMRGKS